jgi:hypothetical protein
MPDAEVCWKLDGELALPLAEVRHAVMPPRLQSFAVLSIVDAERRNGIRELAH